MVDLGKMIERLVAAGEESNRHMKAAYDAAMAASLIASQIARHPLVETLSSEAQEKLQASGELATKLTKGFAEMYGRAQ